MDSKTFKRLMERHQKDVNRKLDFYGGKQFMEPKSIHVIDYDVANDLYMIKGHGGEVQWMKGIDVVKGNYVIANPEDIELITAQRKKAQQREYSNRLTQDMSNDTVRNKSLSSSVQQLFNKTEVVCARAR